MINLKRILPILGIKDISSDELIKKGLEKVDPKFKNFFSEVGKYGYPIGLALGFIKSEFAGKEEPQDRNLRPDQLANAELVRQSHLPQRLVGAIGKTALGGALGSLGGAAISGLGSALDQEKQSPEQNQPQEEAKSVYDPLAGFKDYPELTEFIRKEHSKGGNSLSIGSKARKSSKLFPMVQDIERKAGEEFESLLERLLGSSAKPQASQQSPKMAQFLQALQQLRQMSGG